MLPIFLRSERIVANPECMVRRRIASENEDGVLVCANVSGLYWRAISWPEWNALRSRPT
jgi:hypothetical protein